MNLYAWHWARLKTDLDIKYSFMQTNESFILPKGTIVRAKRIRLLGLAFIDYSGNMFDTLRTYGSILESIEQ